MRVGVVRCHLYGLLLPVGLGTLDNAERVDPDKLDAKTTRKVDGVFKGSRQSVPGDLVSVERVGILVSHDNLIFTPAVTKSNVGTPVRGSCLTESDSAVSRCRAREELDDSLREKVLCCCSAVSVVFLTVVDPEPDLVC